MADKILSISKASKYLGVSSLTLRNWEKKGLIKVYRTPGRHRRYKMSELDRILGLGADEDKLRESIEKLEEVDFKNGRQKKIYKVLADLKNITEES